MERVLMVYVACLFFAISNAEGQNLTITGKVTDTSSGEALPGVNIVVKGTTTGTSTDSEGAYELTVPSLSDTLVFSFIGYQTRQIPINGRTTLDVALQLQAVAGEELVVVGYGTQQRRDVTGAISSVSEEQLKDLPVASFEEALSGQAAGVQVQQVTGAPGGGGVTIRIRGTGSISAGNDPLFVVDGFPLGTKALNTIDPDDIASIEILKDASASAIYGSRGSNGVVIITTKQGRAGDVQISFDSYVGFQQVAKKVDVLNASEFATLVIEARNNAWIDAGRDPNVPLADRTGGAFAIPPAFLNDAGTGPADLGEGTNWQDEIFRTAPMQSYEFSVAGGSENIRYFITGGHFREQGTITNSDFKRYSLRANVDAELNDKLKIGVNVSPGHTVNQVISAAGSEGVVRSALSISPHFPVYDENGDYTYARNQGNISFGAGGFSPIGNPVALAEGRDDNRTTLTLQGNTFAEYNILPNLNFKMLAGADVSTFRRDFFRRSIVSGPGREIPPTNPVGTSSTSQFINWLNENTLTYQTTIRQDHDLKLLGGFTFQKEKAEDVFLTGTNFPNDLVPTLNAAGLVTGWSSRSTEWSLMSLIGRVNYSYKNKYLLTATIRRDGSSRFGIDNRWGMFPSASIGWRISEEEFMQGLSAVSNLKIRTSVGKAGNFSIGNFASLGLLSPVFTVFGEESETLVNGIAQATVSNPELTWETSEQLNIGLELGLFEDRVSFAADFYNKDTSGLLLNVSIPPTTGFTSTLVNIGEVRNRGWEFSLTTRNLVNKFNWSTSFNISFNENEVLKLGTSGDPLFAGAGFMSDTHITQIGSPIGSYYGLKQTGVFLSQEEIDNSPIFEGGSRSTRPGDYKYEDINGDGEITFGEDRTLIGDPFPDFVFGLTNTFSYKNFDLRILLDGNHGMQVVNASDNQNGNSAGNVNQFQHVFDGRFISEQQPGDGKTPRLNRIPTGLNNNFSSRFIEDASFIRARNITFGYSFPVSSLENVSLRKLRVYLSVQNAFTITDYRGYNPEVSVNGGNPLAAGVDFGTYPIAKSFIAGFNLGF